MPISVEARLDLLALGLTELTYDVGRARHPLRLVTRIRRDLTFRDFIGKLAAANRTKAP